MRKNMDARLFAKVFLLTAAILFSVSLLTYGLLAWLMPRTYSNELGSALHEQVENFVSELSQVTFQERGGVFGQFLQNPEISDAKLYDESGSPVPAEPYHSENTYAVAEAVSEQGYGDEAPLVSESFYVSFAGSRKRYMLLVYGNGSRIAQLRQAFVRVLPVLLVLSLLTALFFAYFYAALIMQLQNKNRRLAEDMEQERLREQARLSFFSAVSHELKTPVTIIKGQLEGMLLGIGEYKNHEKYLARSLEITNTLEHLVQELLTVSRLEASGRELKNECFDTVALIRDYLNQIEDLIIERELHIDRDMPPEAMIFGNRLLLEKVFTNLIGNAVKYSPAGAVVRITVRKTQGRFAFQVENSGTHIPDECLPKLFDAFYRVEQSRSRRLGGSGLGLYLVQKILGFYGSRCEVCNTSGGVRFSFVLKPCNTERTYTS